MNEPRTVSETLYLRGMDGDFRTTGPRDEWVTDGDGGRTEDIQALEGFTRESLLYSGGRVVSAEVNTPNVIQTASDGTFTANIVGTKVVAARTLQEDGKWRRTRSTTTFTGEGLPLKVDDEGDTAVTGDETCTQNTYTRNESAWMLNYASQVRAIAKACAVWPGTADDVVSDVKSAYDAEAVGTAPTRGVVSASLRWSGGTNYQRVSGEVTDAYGRPTRAVDIDGKTTTTTYTPETGNPTTVTTKNRVDWISTSTLDPVRGLPLTEVGVNGERTDMEYDPLGRLLRVWAPGWSKADHPTKPTTEYSYEYRLNDPTVVTTKSLRENETYAVSYDLYDGLLRLRQSQTPAVGGGRIISDIFYNSRGLQAKVNGGYVNPDPPSKELSGAFDNQVPNQTVTVYDDLGRPLETILKRLDVEVSRTKTRYAGDTTYTTPPQGDTPTAVFKDALGRIVERRQYHAPSANGEYPASATYDAMTYRYNAKGLLDQITDAQSNQWRYTYDQLGRKKTTVDPDRGTTTFGYNAVDQLESTTDARNEKLVHTYDDLGRPTGLYDGVVSDDTKLSSWTYDSLRKGLPTSATRVVDGHEYTQRVDQYDNLNRPTSVSVVIPAVEGKLAGTYTYGASYSSVTGQLRSETLPKTGELPPETVIHEYDQDGLPLKTYGTNTYASEHLYSPYGESLRVTLGTSPNKVWVNATYEEGTRRLANFEIRRDKTIQPQVANRTYTYDQAGNITKIANRPENGTNDIQCFNYDTLRRMTSAWTPGSGDCTQAKSVATLGGAAPYWYDFTFDKIGNRKTQVQHTSSGDVTETYTVPASGAAAVQPHAVSSVSRTGPTGTSLDEFTYDPAGNVETRTIGGDTQTLEWTPEGRVSKVTEADGAESNYVYDAGGNRLLKKEPHATTLYLPGQELVLATGAAAPTGKRYYTHGGSVVAMRTTVAGLTYVLTDHHGTDEVAITASNLFVSRRYMDPYGERRGNAPSFWPDDKGFVGGVNDTTGLVSIGAREYDPATGRFVSADPILDFGDPQQVHGYAYANNAPATASDPTGLRHLVDNDGRFWWSNGTEWSEEDDQKLKTYYNGNGAVSRVVNDAKNQACGEMGMSSRECGQMQADAQSNKGFWDVMKAELPDLLGDLTGFNDLRDCFTKFNLMACAGIIPWARGFKLIKSAGRVFSAVGKAIRWEDRVSRARSLMTRWSDKVNDLVRKGMDKLKDLHPSKPSSCVKHSFPPGTRVLLADSSSKPIEQVVLGDRVLAVDPETGRTVPRKVVATWVHDDEPERTEVTIDTDGAAGGETATLTGTDWHPVWEPKLGAWVPLGNLRTGSWLQTSSGTWVQATAVRKYHGTGKVHDLSVEDAHTYHVLAGAVATLVHNCGPDRVDADAAPAPGIVWRALAEGEDPALGLTARAPDVANASPLSHVAGLQQSPWISTSKIPSVAFDKYNSGHGVVAVDLDRVTSRVEDISGGFPGKGRFDAWARKGQEVLILGRVPSDAIIGYWP